MSEGLSELPASPSQVDDSARDQFGSGGRTILAECRLRASALVASVGRVASAADLARRLAIDRKLAWHLHSLAAASDPLLAAEHLPGPAGVRKIAARSRRAGVDPAVVERFVEAAAAFEKLRDEVAPDRATLEGMLALASGSTEHAADVLAELRRDSVRSMASLWGVHARAQIRTNILMLNADGVNVDLTDIFGFVGLACFRHPMRWSVGMTRSFDHAGEAFDPNRAALDAAAPRDGPPILVEFCTRPLPTLSATPAQAKMMQIVACDWPIGIQARVDLLLGQVTRSIGNAYAPQPGESADLNTVVCTPCDLLVHDVLVHESLWPATLEPTLTVFNELAPMPAYPARKQERLTIPHRERCVMIGRGARLAFLPQLPRHSQMLAWACEALGHQLGSFAIYRLAVPHPALPARYAVEMPIPTKP